MIIKYYTTPLACTLSRFSAAKALGSAMCSEIRPWCTLSVARQLSWSSLVWKQLQWESLVAHSVFVECVKERSSVSGHKMVTVSNLPLNLLMCAFVLYQIKNLLLHMSHLKCSFNKNRRLDEIRMELTCAVIPGHVSREYTHIGTRMINDNKAELLIDKHDKPLKIASSKCQSTSPLDVSRVTLNLAF